MSIIRLFFIGILGVCFSMNETNASKDPFIVKAENYLNGLRTWSATFKQRQPDGAELTGKLWVKRPGLLRLDYDEPSQSKLYIHDGWVVQRDDRLDETAFIPIDRTPAGFFLDEKIHMNKKVKIAGIKKEKNLVYMKLVRSEDESGGSVILVFQKDPVELKAWYIVDEARNITEVVLKKLEKSHDKPRSWFVYQEKIKPLDHGR